MVYNRCKPKLLSSPEPHRYFLHKLLPIYDLTYLSVERILDALVLCNTSKKHTNYQIYSCNGYILAISFNVFRSICEGKFFLKHLCNQLFLCNKTLNILVLKFIKYLEIGQANSKIFFIIDYDMVMYYLQLYSQIPPKLIFPTSMIWSKGFL